LTFSTAAVKVGAAGRPTRSRQRPNLLRPLFISAQHLDRQTNNCYGTADQNARAISAKRKSSALLLLLSYNLDDFRQDKSYDVRKKKKTFPVTGPVSELYTSGYQET
jgi:hypothetical protein